MPESESFDAFYARTVWNVTSQMHALAAEDGLADHAIREAYARAYQQWYEVSASGDSEGWVLDVAKVAYERRRTEAGGLPASVARAPGHDPLSLPGMFRPARPVAPATSDPESTMAPRPAAHGRFRHGRSRHGRSRHGRSRHGRSRHGRPWHGRRGRRRAASGCPRSGPPDAGRRPTRQPLRQPGTWRWRLQPDS